MLKEVDLKAAEKAVKLSKKNEDRAVAALRRVENGSAWKRAAAYVIVKADHSWGKIKVAYPADGMGPLRVFLWDGIHGIQYGYASGCGYNKLAAALDGMMYGHIKFNEGEWESQLRKDGYEVIQAL